MSKLFLFIPRRFLFGLLLLLASVAAGCDLTSAEDARVQIQITDAPSDYIESAEVWISRVYLRCDEDDDEADDEAVFESDDHERGDQLRSDRDDDDDEGDDEDKGKKHDEDDEDDDEHCERVDLFNDASDPFHVDLLTLRDGLVANLTVPVDLPAGRYDELFVVVDSALVTLASPYKFPNGTSTAALKIAGQGHKPIKVELENPLDAAAGQTTLVLVDFDVDDSFVILGNPNTPAGIKGILFIPRLREQDREQND